MQNAIADAPGIQGGLPLLQPSAGLLLYIAIWVMVQRMQGIQNVLSGHFRGLRSTQFALQPEARY